MSFGPRIMEPPHEPQPNLFDNPRPGCSDNPFGDFTCGEVAGMNQDRRREQRFWEAEHQ